MKLINRGHEFRPEELPTECPICHHKIVAEALKGVQLNDTYSQVAFKCNNPKCEQLFIVTYKYSYIAKIEPKKAKPIIKNDDIEALSPSFYKIYNQANEAETRGLDEISGVGYRKALEFLIKDFCISNVTNDEDKEKNIEKIKSKFLGKVIKENLIGAPKVQSCAEKATWLGNDETHYVRKWEDKDIKDLKLLILLTLHHIEAEILTAKFEADMV